MKTFSDFNLKLAAWVGVLLGLSVRAAWGQCPANCNVVISAANGNQNTAYVLTAGTSFTVSAGATYTGTATVAGNNVVVTNNGTISSQQSGSFIVNAGVSGTVINNNGSVSSQNVYLNSATTLNNGSSSNATATWSGGFIAGRIAAAPAITNYGSFTGQIDNLPGGSISNQGGTWGSTITSTSATLAITNASVWNGPITAGATLNITNSTNNWAASLTMSNASAVTIGTTGNWPSQITANGGALTITSSQSWSGSIGTNSGGGTFTISSSGNWSGQVTANGQVNITNTNNWSGNVSNNSATATNTIASSGGTWSGQVSPGGPYTITATSPWTGNVSSNSSQPSSITTSAAWSGTAQANGALSITNQAGGNWTGTPNSNTSIAVSNAAPWNATVNFPGSMASSFTNLAAGTATFPNLSFNGAATMQNSGTMNFSNAVYPNSNVTITNNKTGTLNTALFSSSGTISNAGLIAVTGDFTNSGTVTGPASPGRGYMTVTGTSNNYSPGVYGVTGLLDFCDKSSSNQGRFDNQNATVGPNVTYCTTRPPLPVVLTSFGAQLRQGLVVLSWTTASEVNNARFVVERSADGRAFGVLHEVAGRGTVATAHTYASTDAHPLPGTSYYRLRQVDVSGESTFSPVVSVSQPAAGRLVVFPNPTADVLTLDFSTLPTADTYPVRLLSLAGQVLLTQAVSPGQPLHLGHLPSGTYLLEATAPTLGRSVQRVVKH